MGLFEASPELSFDLWPRRGGRAGGPVAEAAVAEEADEGEEEPLAAGSEEEAEAAEGVAEGRA